MDGPYKGGHFRNRSCHLVRQRWGEPPNLAPISCTPEEEETCKGSALGLCLPANFLGYGGLSTPYVSVHPEDVSIIFVQNGADRPGGNPLDYVDSGSTGTSRIWGRSFSISGMGCIVDRLKETMQA